MEEVGQILKYSGGDALELMRVVKAFKGFYHMGKGDVSSLGYSIVYNRDYYEDLKMNGNVPPLLVLDQFTRMNKDNWYTTFLWFRVVKWSDTKRYIYIMEEYVREEDLDYYPKEGKIRTIETKPRRGLLIW